MARTKAIEWQAGPADCRRCGARYDAPAWHVRCGDFMCTTCRRKHLMDWRERRAAEGRPVVPGRASPAKDAARRQSPEERRKAATRLATRKAIAEGRLIKQPCERCGGPSEAHHEDYSKPLQVMWLCRHHHMRRHVEIRSQAATGEDSPANEEESAS